MQTELVVSLSLLGAFFGTLIAGPLSDIYGRKKLIIAAALLQVIGAGLAASAWSIPALMVGRVIVGVVLGMDSVLVLIYLSEVAPLGIRGSMIALSVLAVPVGQVIACSISLACKTEWRLMAGLAALPSIIQGIWMIYLPESPRWLAKEGRDAECAEALNKLYHGDAAREEMALLKAEVRRLKDGV